MKTKIKTTIEQRNDLLLLIRDGKYNEANTVAKFLGFPEAVTAELFEYIIAKDGMHMLVIQAIGVYYNDEIKPCLKGAQ